MKSKDATSAAGWALQAARKTRAGGRPVIKDRCRCGRYTKTLAAKRGHKC